MAGSRRRELVFAWLPALVYMVVIWTVSSVTLPTFPTSLFPMRDKGVHAVEYGVLGFLLAHACLRTWRERVQDHATLRIGLFAILFGVLWGVLDEIHQAFVPGRSADALDVAADTVGVALGTNLRILAGHLRRMRTPTSTPGAP